jgi:hypothetical protein
VRTLFLPPGLDFPGTQQGACRTCPRPRGPAIRVTPVRLALALLLLIAAGSTAALVSKKDPIAHSIARNGNGTPRLTAVPAPDGGPAAVDLAARVTAYVAPFRAGRGYTEPTAAERGALADGTALLVAGRRSAALAELSAVGYRVTGFRDLATGRRFDEVADADPAREAARGWGRIYLDLSATDRWSVQVPHPVADQNTEKVGVAVFRAAPGGVLVVAGAHRRAGPGTIADAAHSATTVFAAVLDRLSRDGMPGIQVHGFDEGSLPGVDTVFSPGAALPGTAAVSTAEALSRDGFAVCRPWVEGCGKLAGTTNLAGRYAAARGVPFLHVEMSPAVRADPDTRQRIAAVLGRTVAEWNAGRWLAVPRRD